MLFNSIDFAVFLPIVFVLYWFVFRGSLRLQNLLIVVSSYIFYGWWDWRFLLLIVFSTVVDFLIGNFLKKEENRGRRKVLLWLSVGVNLGVLGFFKYYNFFVENFIEAFSFFGRDIQPNTLNIILPVGISFYTFQTLSYTIDVYRRKLEPTSDFVAFSAFVAFFPQLVAGPIERAKNLLPQFYAPRKFEYANAVVGLRQILWGLFKKIVIADNAAQLANLVFENSSDLNGSTLILGAVFFTFQIYGDFSGYSDIAIGTARLFGFDLMRNFAYPYFSRDIGEFWRRWHISLSTWFRDYVYIPLGGSQGSTSMKIRNVFIIFIVSGFWHGANWTFIFWGLLNALYFLPLLLAKKNRANLEIVAAGRYLPGGKELIHMGITFGLTVFAWIFFRAESLGHAFEYVGGILSWSSFALPEGRAFMNSDIHPLTIILLIVIFMAIEWFGREHHFAMAKMQFLPKRALRYGVYTLLILSIIVFGGQEQEFIYFQF